MADFIPGKIDIVTEEGVSVKCLSERLKQWEESSGYVAYSTCEEAKCHDAPIDIDFNKRIEEKGYVMELNLWANNGQGKYRELSVEREDRGMFVQDWTLDTKVDESKSNCYWRYVKTKPRGRLFKALESIEVVVPDTRLHIFITKRGKVS